PRPRTMPAVSGLTEEAVTRGGTRLPRSHHSRYSLLKKNRLLKSLTTPSPQPKQFVSCQVSSGAATAKPDGGPKGGAGGGTAPKGGAGGGTTNPGGGGPPAPGPHGTGWGPRDAARAS